MVSVILLSEQNAQVRSSKVMQVRSARCARIADGARSEYRTHKCVICKRNREMLGSPWVTVGVCGQIKRRVSMCLRKMTIFKCKLLCLPAIKTYKNVFDTILTGCEETNKTIVMCGTWFKFGKTR